jgi:hypothetical protein
VPLPHVVVPERPPPGGLAGALLGAPAGLFLASIWLYGEWDVALAVTAVYAGLVAVLAGAPAWRPFAKGLVPSSVLAAGLLALIAG